MEFTITLTDEMVKDLKAIEADQIEREGSCDFKSLVEWFVMTGIENYDPDDIGG
jgi:hypothetical protein